ncbi:hypothetical protein [Luteimonas kalidii]|uniref:Transmembrane repetitive protein n=1 Tax=Luteimonas kalidii TaxID=3042025 RepID=A0ABT6JSI2_9GAMM|nr:hypothetical protein [Luteimonas kalidii]MDH5833649.1 hypothetical protein [Luteimonas kalidii]
MFSSADLIEAVQRALRKGRSIRPPRPPGEWPPGWNAWFANARIGPVRPIAAVPDALVGVLLLREPLHATGYRRLTGLQAFARLWRHDWRERPAPDRRTRRFAMVSSVLLHALWLQLMILFMVGRFPSGEEEAERLGETITQVEFIGEGTPEAEGGGTQQAEQPAPAVAASQAPAAAAPAAASPEPPPPAPPPSVAEVEPVPEAVPPPVVEQPLEVTETSEPDSDFQLAPPRIDAPPMRALPTPELQAPAPEIRVVEVPLATPPPQVRPLPRREISVPDLDQPEVEIVERAVPSPAPEVSLRAPRPIADAAPELRREGPAIAERAIELRAPTPAAGTAQGTANRVDGAPSASGQASSTAAAAGGTRDAGEGATPAASTAGAGPASSPAPGALPSPRRGDDWGDSDRNVPGGQAGSPGGLFNADGSPRLAGNTGATGGGLPPGTITEDFEKIDRMGTWLKRPPIGYEPTAFDRFWVPHETLLEEWVRRSIKEVLIPIPGTGKRIRCTVAMLMLGGACGLSDPNMLDVEAEARRPPDVPFKRELQEDQDSLAPAPATNP